MTTGGSQHYQQMTLLPGVGPYARFAVVGGKLIVRQSNGNLLTLVDSTINFNGTRLIDVSDPTVSWDGTKIVFAGIEHRDSCWRIYEINSDGTNFRQITFTDRTISLSQFGAAAVKFTKYHDIDPCYLPDGRICFASTRSPSLSFYGTPTTNLYVINSDGTYLHRITTERNGAEQPSIDPQTGKIIFSRWWLNIDLPSNQTWNGITRDPNLALSQDKGDMWTAATINPDGTRMGLYAGYPFSRIGMHNYKPVASKERLFGVFFPATSMSTTSGSPGIRWFNKGASDQTYIAGVNMDNMQSYNGFPEEWGIMNPPFATDPYILPDDRVLFSAANQVEFQDYGIYVIEQDGSNMQSVFNIPGMMDLNASLLQARPVPPIIPDVFTEIIDELPPTIEPSSYFKNGAVRFDCENIFFNGPVDFPIPDAPQITRNARIKLFLNFQRTDPDGKDTAILYLNEPVQYSGGFWIPEIPGDVPAFDQVVDEDGNIIGSPNGHYTQLMGLNYGRSGTGTQCVGCHVGHSLIKVPNNSYSAQFFNISTSATVEQSSFKVINDSTQFPGSKVKDRKARNEDPTVNWIANGSNNEWVKLKWDIPIDVEKFVLYNIIPNASAGTNIQVTDCDVFMFYNGQQVGHIPSIGPLSTEGTEIELDSLVKVDEVKVVVNNFTGQIMGQSVAGLAEVETIAKISFYEIVSVKNISEIAEGYSLSQNYPNPFNPKTNFEFSIPKSGHVNLSVYDLLGREVSVVVNQSMIPGTYKIEFDGSRFASGIYFYRLTVSDQGSAPIFNSTKRMVLIK